MSKLDRINKMRQASFSPSKAVTPVLDVPVSETTENEALAPAVETATLESVQASSVPAAVETPVQKTMPSINLLQEIKQSNKKQTKTPLTLKLDNDLRLRLLSAADKIGCTQTAIITTAIEKALDELGY